MGNIGNSNSALVNESGGTRQQIGESGNGLFGERTSSFALRLTHRERQILNYMAQGCLNKQIANTLGISEQTTKNHVSSILGKLGACRRTEAVVSAIRKGLLSLEEIGSRVN